jgi:hypothetical protein
MLYRVQRCSAITPKGSSSLAQFEIFSLQYGLETLASVVADPHKNKGFW